MRKKNGKYIVPNGANIWPHEEATAKVLIRYGHIVEFITKSNYNKIRTVDVYIDDEI